MTLRRILAVSHEGAVGGAPIVMADLLGWIRDHTDIEVHTLMLSAGPMWRRFDAVGDVTVLDELPEPTPESPARRLDPLGRFDLVLLNSLGSLLALPLLPPGVPVVSHIHELQVACRMWGAANGPDLLRTGPDAWVAASRPVADMLVDEVGAPRTACCCTRRSSTRHGSPGERSLPGRWRSSGGPSGSPATPPW